MFQTLMQLTVFLICLGIGINSTQGSLAMDPKHPKTVMLSGCFLTLLILLLFYFAGCFTNIQEILIRMVLWMRR